MICHKINITIESNQELVRHCWGQLDKGLDPSPKNLQMEAETDNVVVDEGLKDDYETMNKNGNSYADIVDE